MATSPALEFPPEQDAALKKARRLEWVTLVFLVSVATLMYFVLGSSQAMKTAWIEDLLSLIPPAVFLVATRVATWPPNDRFVYGYHRVVSIAFLCASLALLTTGIYLLADAAFKLIKAEHPTIGGVSLFGHTIWLGWLMIPTLVYGTIPAVLLGRAKLPLARTMHDKVLFADADMNKADWMTGLAAIVGVLGIGLGFWWTDAVAAGLISLSVLRDGYFNLKEVVTNLMDEVPKKVGESERDPLPQKLENFLRSLPWITDASVRMREQGHVYFGEAFVVIKDGYMDQLLDERLYDATQKATSLDWRIHDLVLAPVPQLPSRSQGGPHQ